MVERPEDWAWSTYPQLLGQQQAWLCFDREATLALFGSADDVERIVDDQRSELQGSSPETSTSP